METNIIAPCSFIRYEDSENSLEPDSSPDEQRRAALQSITTSIMALAPADAPLFEVAIAVTNVIGADADRHGYNQPAVTRIRAYFGNNADDVRFIHFIEVEGPNQDLFRPHARYQLFSDGWVMFNYVWLVSINLMNQIDITLANMVEMLNSPV